MEMGNQIFGNSRGVVEVDRSLQGRFIELLNDMGFDGYGNSDFSESWIFENHVFRIQPYYWGDCECDYEDAWDEFFDKNKHSEDCYRSELKREKISAGIHYSQESNLPFDERRKIENKIYKILTKKHKLPMRGCAVHCNCGLDELANSQDINHSKYCLIATPNFTFKPTEFTLSWYKYALRDSYSSELLTRDLMEYMMKECKDSLKVKK